VLSAAFLWSGPNGPSSHSRTDQYFSRSRWSLYIPSLENVFYSVVLYAVCRRFSVQMHTGMCEHVTCRADELLALVTGLVTGDLQKLTIRYKSCPHKFLAVTCH
jgi:hypothetical protein